MINVCRILVFSSQLAWSKHWQPLGTMLYSYELSELSQWLTINIVLVIIINTLPVHLLLLSMQIYRWN